MKKIFIILCTLAFVASCGSSKDNKVNSTEPVEQVQSSGLETQQQIQMAALATFTGDYDILRREANNCANMIKIVYDCNGVKLLSDGFNVTEEFCNVNRGIVRTRSGNQNDSSPPNPDRNPPNPDRRDPRSQDEETRTVTLDGNILKSELRLNDRISFSSSLTMNNNGILVRDSKLKSSFGRCIYQKRI